MNSTRQIKINVTVSSAEIVRALKLAYPHDLGIQSLPAAPTAKDGTVAAALLGACGLDITYLTSATTASSRELMVIS